MKATKVQYREFLNSFIWEDLKAILRERLEDVRHHFEIDASADPWEDIKQVAHNRGRAEELRYLLELPGFIIQNFESLVEYDRAVKSTMERGEEDGR